MESQSEFKVDPASPLLVTRDEIVLPFDPPTDSPLAEPVAKPIVAIEAPIALGIITTETGDQYHATKAVSASKLRVFKRNPGGPQLYFQRFISKTLKDEDSAAKLEGRALHSMLFEPEKFEGEFCIIPPDAPDRPTKQMLKAAKPSAESLARVGYWQKFDEESKGKGQLTASVFRRLQTQTTNARNHPKVAELLAKGRAETTWRIKAPGLPNIPALQCRTDWFCAEGCELSEGRPYVLDAKTTATLERSAFGNFHRGAREHAYHHQAALYMSIMGALGVEVFDFFFAAIEKAPPYGVEVYKLKSRSIERGQAALERILIDLDRCYSANVWPNTDLEVQELTIRDEWTPGIDDEE